ncbi:Uncharacterised protein [Orientia tsutsugamushi str. Gilliam]|uniref:Uncharacterized protein n=1 Tax=Orientia tsutsugamushi str. Gilliam TaxID=1359184 RepID=A0A2U3QX88_ORITS|nr:hypothetical protein [Orientia tsutsugamushi]SPR05529.1 Uncharacterised protein [Orientia tsutsugamushi str. Gilliam]
MHKFLTGLISASSLLTLSVSSLASTIPQSKTDDHNPQTTVHEQNDTINLANQTIEEYKIYIRTVPESVRTEISDYRIKLHKINQEKQNLYNKLSFEAQDYLKQVQVFKKKLKNIINDDSKQKLNNESEY